MYIIKGNIFAEAGKILIGNNKIGLFFKDFSENFTERALDLDSIVVDNGILKFDVFSWNISDCNSYTDLKKYLIKKRYSNDDQIAIILNKDDSEEDQLAYQKMQEWREWASIFAKKIMDVINK